MRPAPITGWAALLAAASLALAPLAGRSDDAGPPDDAGAPDAAPDAAADGGWYTMSGSTESGCTCATPGRVGGVTRPAWPLVALLIESFSPRE
jgi:hypothetical protein